MQRSLWQIRCITRSVQRTAAFMNFRMWHFPEGYISDERLTKDANLYGDKIIDDL